MLFGSSRSLIVILAIVQEMVARLGVITVRVDLIRERFGVALDGVRDGGAAPRSTSRSHYREHGRRGGGPRHLRRPEVDHGAGRGRRDLGSRAVRVLPDRRAGSCSCMLVSAIRSPRSWPPPDWTPVFKAFVTPTIPLRPGDAPFSLSRSRARRSRPTCSSTAERRCEKGRFARRSFGSSNRTRSWFDPDECYFAVFIVAGDRRLPVARGRRGAHDQLRGGRGQGPRACRPRQFAEVLFGVGLFRLGARGDDHAALDRVRDLRGLRLGERRRQAVQRRAGVLRDLLVRVGARRHRRAPGAQGSWVSS